MKFSKIVNVLLSFLLVILIGSTGVLAENQEDPDSSIISGEGAPIKISYKLSNTPKNGTYENGHLQYLGSPVDCVFRITVKGKKQGESEYKFVDKDTVFNWKLVDHSGITTIVPNEGNLIAATGGVLKYGDYDLEIFSPAYGSLESVSGSIPGSQPPEDYNENDNKVSNNIDYSTSNTWVFELKPTKKALDTYPGGFQVRVEEWTTGPFKRLEANTIDYDIQKGNSITFDNVYDGITSSSGSLDNDTNWVYDNNITTQLNFNIEALDKESKIWSQVPETEIPFKITETVLDGNKKSTAIDDNPNFNVSLVEGKTSKEINLTFSDYGTYCYNIEPDLTNKKFDEVFRKDIKTGIKVICEVKPTDKNKVNVQYMNYDCNRWDKENNTTISLREKVKEEKVLVDSITVEPSVYNLQNNNTKQLKGSVLPNMASQTIQWKSSKPEVASVDSSGKVTANNPGIAIITANATDESGVLGECTITVPSNQTVESDESKEENVVIKIDGGNKTVSEGDKDFTLTAIITPSSASKSVTWVSDNPAVAQIVSTDGLKTTIKAGQPGIAHITCTHNNSKVQDTYTITVAAKKSDEDSGGSSGCSGSDKPNEPEKIEVKSVSIKLPNEFNNSVKVGDSIQLYSVIEPQNASNQEVTWTSSNPKVAEVSSTGLVKTLSVGTSIISVETKDGNKKDEIEITVTEETEKPDNPNQSNPTTVTIYRLNNPVSHEHLFTSDKNEYDSLPNSSDWEQEGIAWNAPSSGKPVYRLYSPVTGAHLYTMDENEVNTLLGSGIWQADNDKKPLMFSGGSKKVYRLYHEGIRMHLLTTDENEYNILGVNGWNQEGVKINCL